MGRADVLEFVPRRAPSPLVDACARFAILGCYG